MCITQYSSSGIVLNTISDPLSTEDIGMAVPKIRDTRSDFYSFMTYHIVYSVHMFHSLLQLVSAQKTPHIGPSKGVAAFFNPQKMLSQKCTSQTFLCTEYIARICLLCSVIAIIILLLSTYGILIETDWNGSL